MSIRQLIFIFIVLIVILASRFFFFYQAFPEYRNGQKIILQAVLQETPEISNRGQKLIIKNSLNQRFYIQTNLSKTYHYGDRLAIEGILQVRKSTKGYVYYSLNYPRILALPRSKNSLTEASTIIRQKSLRLFNETLPPVSANLLLGIVFGAKGDFSDDFYQKLQSTGVLHIIAASGMNVSFFTGAIMFSLGAFLKRRIAIFISIFAVIFYSFLVGFEPSILRASLMAILTFTASFFGRQAFSVLVLFITGYLLLLWKPSFLFDIGFQLSFMATLGILLMKPALDSLSVLKKLGGLREDFNTTLSAQLSTFPILLGTFGKIGILSLPVNMLVLWTVPILMLLGSLGILMGLIFAPLGKMFLYLSLPLLIFFEQVISFFGSFNWNLSIDNLPWQMGVGYYLVLGAIVFSKGIMKHESRSRGNNKLKP